jgi:Na+/H+-translocating membrane pyrophosphatase
MVYWKLITNSKLKKLIIAGAATTLLAYIISCFFQNPISIYLYQATVIGSIVLVISVVLYFFDKHRNKEMFFQKYNLAFWVSLGLIIFYTFFPILLLISYTDYDVWEKYNLKTILRSFIIIMYTLFAVGFIKGRKREFG